MARRVYFAFHYQRDVWRVNQVRNSWVTQEREAAGFYDASLWEEAKKQSDLAIKRMINGGIQNTTVTCVLVGTETSKRRWVQYEIIKSYDKGNGLLGVYIHTLKDQDKQTCNKGADPFDDLGFTISSDAKSAEAKVWKNSTWAKYDDYPTITKTFKPEYAGKFFRLSQIGIKMYDWTDDNGYEKFNKWVDKSIE